MEKRLKYRYPPGLAKGLGAKKRGGGNPRMGSSIRVADKAQIWGGVGEESSL